MSLIIIVWSEIYDLDVRYKVSHNLMNKELKGKHPLSL